MDKPGSYFVQKGRKLIIPGESRRGGGPDRCCVKQFEKNDQTPWSRRVRVCVCVCVCCVCVCVCVCVFVRCLRACVRVCVCVYYDYCFCCRRCYWWCRCCLINQMHYSPYQRKRERRLYSLQILYLISLNRATASMNTIKHSRGDARHISPKHRW